MHCQKLQKWVLLDETGELNAWQRARLTSHLRVCADCRSFKCHAAAVRQANPAVTDQPAPWIMAEIQDAIRAGVPARPGAIRLIWWRHPQVLRMAASFIALLAGAWLMLHTLAPGPPDSTELVEFSMGDTPWLDLLLTENVVEIRRLEEVADVVTALEIELMLVEGLAI